MFYGEYVRQLRLSRRFTLRLFCQGASINVVAESRIERGIEKPHDEDTRGRIVSLLALTEDEINTMNRLAGEYVKQEEKELIPLFPFRRRLSDATQCPSSDLDSRK
jgi:transcriptional regulator with XRE-family HTH domain